jgi:hypothetical protein
MDRPFYWRRVEDGPTSAPSGWYQWKPEGLVYLGESVLDPIDSGQGPEPERTKSTTENETLDPKI